MRKLTLITVILIAFVSLTSYKTYEMDEPPLFRVMYGDPWGNYSVGYIDKDGNMVVDYIYIEGEEFHEGLAAVRNGRGCGYINGKGEVVIDPIFDFAGDFSCGLARIKIDGKWGYVDTTLTITIPCQYDSCYVAGKELCKVYSSKSDEVKVVSYIRRNGEIVWQNTIVSSFMDKYKPSKPLSNWAMNKKQKRK